MAVATSIGSNEYRVLLIDPASSKVWVSEREEGYRLIRVTAAQRTRLARQLQETLRKTWGITVLILDFLTVEESVSPCAIAELLHGDVPNGLRAVQPEQISSDELSERERALLIAVLAGKAVSPIARVGWIDEAIAWIESSTGRRVSSKADLEQYNAGDAFTLIRFRTEGGTDYWIKATGAPNSHERAVTLLLSTLCPGYVPEVIADRPAWNAWLMQDDGSHNAPRSGDPSQTIRLLEGAAESLAQLQIRTTEGILDLFDAGAFDHRTHVLRDKAEMLFAFLHEAMALQTSVKAPRIEPKRLFELQSLFVNVCDAIEDLGLPDTVLHGDMNLGNILFTRSHCVFIDWAEANVGNPLITLEHLLLLNQIEDPPRKAFYDQCLRESYRAILSRRCAPKAINRAFVCMPLLAAASTIFGRGEWLRTPLRSDPRRQAHARAIARHMDRAARDPLLLKTLSI